MLSPNPRGTFQLSPYYVTVQRWRAALSAFLAPAGSLAAPEALGLAFHYWISTSNTSRPFPTTLLTCCWLQNPHSHSQLSTRPLHLDDTIPHAQKVQSWTHLSSYKYTFTHKNYLFPLPHLTSQWIVLSFTLFHSCLFSLFYHYTQSVLLILSPKCHCFYSHLTQNSPPHTHLSYCNSLLTGLTSSVSKLDSGWKIKILKILNYS